MLVSKVINKVMGKWMGDRLNLKKCTEANHVLELPREIKETIYRNHRTQDGCFVYLGEIRGYAAVWATDKKEQRPYYFYNGHCRPEYMPLVYRGDFVSPVRKEEGEQFVSKYYEQILRLHRFHHNYYLAVKYPHNQKTLYLTDTRKQMTAIAIEVEEDGEKKWYFTHDKVWMTNRELVRCISVIYRHLYYHNQSVMGVYTAYLRDVLKDYYYYK